MSQSSWNIDYFSRTLCRHLMFGSNSHKGVDGDDGHDGIGDDAVSTQRVWWILEDMTWSVDGSIVAWIIGRKDQKVNTGNENDNHDCVNGRCGHKTKHVLIVMEEDPTPKGEISPFMDKYKAFIELFQEFIYKLKHGKFGNTSTTLSIPGVYAIQIPPGCIGQHFLDPISTISQSRKLLLSFDNGNIFILEGLTSNSNSRPYHDWSLLSRFCISQATVSQSAASLNTNRLIGNDQGHYSLFWTEKFDGDDNGHRFCAIKMITFYQTAKSDGKGSMIISPPEVIWASTDGSSIVSMEQAVNSVWFIAQVGGSNLNSVSVYCYDKLSGRLFHCTVANPQRLGTDSLSQLESNGSRPIVIGKSCLNASQFSVLVGYKLYSIIQFSHSIGVVSMYNLSEIDVIGMIITDIVVIDDQYLLVASNDCVVEVKITTRPLPEICDASIVGHRDCYLGIRVDKPFYWNRCQCRSDARKVIDFASGDDVAFRQNVNSDRPHECSLYGMNLFWMRNLSIERGVKTLGIWNQTGASTLLPFYSHETAFVPDPLFHRSNDSSFLTPLPVDASDSINMIDISASVAQRIFDDVLAQSRSNGSSGRTLPQQHVVRCTTFVNDQELPEQFQTPCLNVHNWLDDINHVSLIRLPKENTGHFNLNSSCSHCIHNSLCKNFDYTRRGHQCITNFPGECSDEAMCASNTQTIAQILSLSQYSAFDVARVVSDIVTDAVNFQILVADQLNSSVNDDSFSRLNEVYSHDLELIRVFDVRPSILYEFVFAIQCVYRMEWRRRLIDRKTQAQQHIGVFMSGGYDPLHYVRHAAGVLWSSMSCTQHCCRMHQDALLQLFLAVGNVEMLSVALRRWNRLSDLVDASLMFAISASYLSSTNLTVIEVSWNASALSSTEASSSNITSPVAHMAVTRTTSFRLNENLYSNDLGHLLHPDVYLRINAFAERAGTYLFEKPNPAPEVLCLARDKDESNSLLELSQPVFTNPSKALKVNFDWPNNLHHRRRIQQSLSMFNDALIYCCDSASHPLSIDSQVLLEKLLQLTPYPLSKDDIQQFIQSYLVK